MKTPREGLVEELLEISQVYRDLEASGRSLDEEIVVAEQQLEAAERRLKALREVKAMRSA